MNIKRGLIGICQILFILPLLAICLSGCAMFKMSTGVDPENLTIQNRTAINNVWTYISDTMPGIEYYLFNKRGDLTGLVLTDDSSGKTLHKYSLDFFSKGRLLSVAYWDKRKSYQHEINFNRSGFITYIMDDSLFDRKRNWYLEGSHYTYYHLVGDSNIIDYHYDYAADQKSRSTEYKDNGTLDRTIDMYKRRMEGEMNYYYRSKALKTHIIMHNDKIVSIIEYDDKGNKIPETKVEAGNGRWLRCNEDEGYCCDCKVINGKLKHCKSLLPPKSSKR